MPLKQAAVSADRSSLVNIKSEVLLLALLLVISYLFALASDMAGGAFDNFFVSMRTAFAIVTVAYKPISIYVRKPEVRALLLANMRQYIPNF